MKPIKTPERLATYSSWIIYGIIALLPFHAFITVWLSSGVGHYTLLRLWKEILLTPVFIVSVYLVLKDRVVVKKLGKSRLLQLIVAYIILLLAVGLISYGQNGVNLKALAYGELLDLRYILFFLATLVIANYSRFLSLKWRAIIIMPATLVIIFGLIQYLFLPYDFLKHFGYGVNTISPYETINHNLNRIRIASTLRGANPLGAYLIIAISAAVVLLRKFRKNLTSQAFWITCALACLVFTFSRSAWIGAFIAVGFVVWLNVKTDITRKIIVYSGTLFVVLVSLTTVLLRDNTAFQDALLHTDNKSTIPESSNQGHSAAFRAGIHDIIYQPLGSGLGTAGPASAYNFKPARIAENYYLQVGQEAGILAIGFFIAINILVGIKLWQNRADDLSLILLASLIGISFVNLLSHAWTDDTLAYIWWGLAGIALAPVILGDKAKRNVQKIKK